MLRKGLILSLTAALFAVLAAQSTAQQVMPANSAIVPVNHGSAVVVEGCGSCGEHKVCVPTTEMKKTNKRVYGSVCEDVCYPKCASLFGGLSLFGHGDECGDSCGKPCGGCGSCSACGTPTEKKYLLVKIRHEEKCETKCVVVSEPAAPVCETSWHLPKSCHTSCPAPCSSPCATEISAPVYQGPSLAVPARVAPMPVSK